MTTAAALLFSITTILHPHQPTQAGPTPGWRPPLDNWQEQELIQIQQAHQVWLVQDYDNKLQAEAERLVAEAEARKRAQYPTDAMLYRLRMCESTDRYDTNTGNGFYGAYQFLRGTWDSVALKSGRADLVGVRPDLALPADQDAQTIALWNMSNPHTQWPVCTRILGF